MRIIFRVYASVCSVNEMQLRGSWTSSAPLGFQNPMLLLGLFRHGERKLMDCPHVADLVLCGGKGLEWLALE